MSRRLVNWLSPRPYLNIYFGMITNHCQVFFAGSFLYFAELWSIKFSINLFHLRLTRRLGTVHRIAHYCLYFLVITFIIVVFLTIFDCIPVSDHFTGKCNPNVRNPVFWFPAAINIVTDFILCIIPLPALMTINERRIRITISFVFCLAGSVVLVSLVRVVLISRNPGKNGSWIIILSHIEVTAGLVISAIPDFSKYFTRKYLQSTVTGDYANTGGVSDNRNTLRTAHNRGNGVLDSIASARLKKEGFSGLRGESQKSKSEDEELESVRTDTRPGQRTLGFHSNHSQESTQEIIPAAHGMDAGLEATTFQMKVL